MNSAWLSALRRYVLFLAPANLAWETAHLPLYTVWREGTAREKIVAVVHCTGGDLLIAHRRVVRSSCECTPIGVSCARRATARLSA